MRGASDTSRTRGPLLLFVATLGDGERGCWGPASCWRVEEEGVGARWDPMDDTARA